MSTPKGRSILGTSAYRIAALPPVSCLTGTDGSKWHARNYLDGGHNKWTCVTAQTMSAKEHMSRKDDKCHRGVQRGQQVGPIGKAQKSRVCIKGSERREAQRRLSPW